MAGTSSSGGHRDPRPSTQAHGRWLVAFTLLPLILSLVVVKGAVSEEDLVSQALESIEQGRHGDAMEALTMARQRAPGEANILNLLSATYLRAGKFPEALDAAEAAVSADGTQAVHYLNYGNALRHMQRADAAVEALLQAVELTGGQQSWCYQCEAALATALVDAGGDGAAGAALPHLQRAAEIAEAERAALAEGESTEFWDDAVASAYNNLAHGLLTVGRVDEAVSAATKATALRPAMFEAAATLGAALLLSGDYQGAHDTLETAVSMRPDDVTALQNLAAALVGLDLEAEAGRVLQRTIDIDHTHVPAHLWFGDEALRCSDQFHSARKHYQAAIDGADLRGDAAHARQLALEAEIKVTTTLPVIWDDDPRAESQAHLIEARASHMVDLADAIRRGDRPTLAASSQAAGATLGFEWQYRGGNDRRAREAMSLLYRAAMPGLSFVAPHAENANASPSRVRVGFLSAHFAYHSVGKLIRGVVIALPRDRFHVSVIFAEARTAPPDCGDLSRSSPPAFASGDSSSKDHSVYVAQQIACSADEVVVLGQGGGNEKQTVAELRLDVLVYPEIGLSFSVYKLAHARLARHQVAYWGHPVTSGIPTVDYFVTSKKFLKTAALLPSAASLPLCNATAAGLGHSEQLLCFESLTTAFLQPPPPTEAVLQEAGAMFSNVMAGRGSRVYLVPQYTGKLTPSFDETLERILELDDGAVIALIVPNSTRAQCDWRALRARWQRARPRLAAALSSGAVAALPELSPMAYLAVARAADVVVDPIPVGGGVSSLEMLSVGAIIVTAPEAYSTLRLTPAWLEALGLPELIVYELNGCSSWATSLAARAVTVASRPQWRDAVRSHIIKNAPSVLYDGKAVVDEWAEVLSALAGV